MNSGDNSLNVDFTGTHFNVNGESVEGVHAVISSAFYPKYTWERAKFGPTGIRTVAASRQSGIERGKQLDDDLVKITKLLVALPDLELTHLFELDTLLPFSWPASTKSRVQRIRRSLGSHCMQICAAMHMHQLRPIASQLNVGHELLRVGTAVDLVCRDKHNTLVLVEIKCGFDSYYYHHTEHNMEPPFQDQDDSPHNQHQIQLALTMVLFCRTRNIPMTNVRGIVMRSMSAGVTIHHLAQWARSRVLDMQTAIASRNNRLNAAKLQDRKETGRAAPAALGTFIAMDIAPRNVAKSSKKQKKTRLPPNGVSLAKLTTKKKKATKVKRGAPNSQLIQRTISDLSGKSARPVVRIKRTRRSRV